MDGPGKIPGAEALGDFDVSDLRGRSSLGELRALTPSPSSYVDLIPQEPAGTPPPWWAKTGQPAVGDPSAMPAAGLSAGAQWVRDNLGPSSVQWWYRENYTDIPATAVTSMLVGNVYTVPAGQALAILNVIPMLFGSAGPGDAIETNPMATQFMAAFRMSIAGRSSLDAEHIGPAFGGSTANRWDTGVMNQPMYWGNASVRVPFTLYAREGEKLVFELVGATTMANVRTAINTQLSTTAAYVGYRATGVLVPMSYLF